MKGCDFTMKIRLLRDNTLIALKMHRVNNVPKYKDGSHEWIDEIFEDKSKVFISRIEDPQITLITEGGHSTTHDAENAIKLFQAYQPFITPVMAAEERLWASLCHNQYYDYMLHRWPIEVKAVNQTEEGIIKKRYFFEQGPRKSQERNGLARLWLSAAMTYDESRLDPFELTKVLLQNTNFTWYLFGHQYGSNKNLVQGTTQAIHNLQQTFGATITKKPLTEFARYLNLLSGATALDRYSMDEFRQMAEDHMLPFIEQ